MNPRCTNYGCTRTAKPPHKRCKPCREAINAKLRRRVAHRRRLGLCPCGRKRAYRRKRCQQCLDYFSGHQAEKRENRLIDGVCRRCGSPELAWRTYATGERRQLGVCEQCRTIAKRAWHPSADYRRKKTARIERARAAHRCTACRKPAYYDPDKKVWRLLCMDHLEVARRRIARWVEKQRAAGRCERCKAPAIYDAKRQVFLSRCKRHLR